MSKLFATISAALLLTAVSPSLATAQEEPRLGVEELESIVAATRAEIFRPGEYVEGWDRGGANPEADLRAAGTETHYFQSRRRECGDPYQPADHGFRAEPVACRR